MILQVFIYLNRRASLVDTTTCRPAYHIAEPGEGKQPFPVRSYDLLGGGNSTGSRDLGKVGYSDFRIRARGVLKRLIFCKKKKPHS